MTNPKYPFKLHTSITYKLKDQLKRTSKRLGMSMSDYTRSAIEEKMANEGRIIMRESDFKITRIQIKKGL
jgi:hypothetical protein